MKYTCFVKIPQLIYVCVHKPLNMRPMTKNSLCVTGNVAVLGYSYLVLFCNINIVDTVCLHSSKIRKCIACARVQGGGGWA